MGAFFNSFLTGWNHGRERAKNESIRKEDKPNFPLKLVEPSVGRIVEFEVTETKEPYARLYMDQVITYATCIEKLGGQYTVTGKTVKIVFPNDTMAENVLQQWRK